MQVTPSCDLMCTHCQRHNGPMVLVCILNYVFNWIGFFISSFRLNSQYPGSVVPLTLFTFICKICQKKIQSQVQLKATGELKCKFLQEKEHTLSISCSQRFTKEIQVCIFMKCISCWHPVGRHPDSVSGELCIILEHKTCHTTLIQMPFLSLKFHKMAKTNCVGGHRKEELVQGKCILSLNSNTLA